MSPIYHNRGLVLPFVSSTLNHLALLTRSRAYRKLQAMAILHRGKPRHEPGVTRYCGRTVNFLDSHSFLYAWDDIMVNGVYDIGDADNPHLVDCGANIGLAQLYWKLRYDSFTSVCFEPDKEIFAMLQRNLVAWDCRTEAHCAAVGANAGEGVFLATGADDGHLAAEGSSVSGVKTEVRRLSPFLERPVDLLKIDVEGSEWGVLEEIRPRLEFVKRLFLECHDGRDSPQRLPDILALLKAAGYRCYTTTAQGSSTPLSKFEVTRDGFDQTTHVFALRPEVIR
jgi:FkbM family methyltransferase